MACETAPVRVRGDATQLAEVVSNLVANALRHTPAGGTIRVDASVSEGSVVLLVRDTGPGIDPALLASQTGSA